MNNPFAMFFNVAYMVAIWTMFALILRAYRRAAPAQRVRARWLGWAVFLLASGDLVHVLTQFYAFFTKTDPMAFNWAGHPVSWMGIGFLASSFTMTLFYLLLLFYYHRRFTQPWTWWDWTLLGLFLVRFLILPCPLNEWSGAPTPWRLYRNIPFTLAGLGVAYLLFRAASGLAEDLRRWAWILSGSILASFIFYWGVLIFAPAYPPITALMLPKSVAYVVAVYSLYRLTFQAPLEPSKVMGARPA